jgi:hypothetical protein
MQRHELEVDELHERPDHVVGRQGRHVALLELVLGRRALQHRHAAKEDANEGRREDALVEGDAGQDGAVCAAQVDVALQELEPGCRCWSEDGWWELFSIEDKMGWG